MRPDVSSMIPEQKDKSWNGAHQTVQDPKNFDLKGQKTK
jgi:hypothetical protein